jgi:uncharacterized protein (UPF0332 family)
MSGLDDDSRKALVAYRLERAYATMKEAAVMTEKEFYNAAVNRLYYACYYATEALLLKHKIEAKSHSGVKAMLGLHFVSKGLVPVSIGKILSTLYEKRQSGDYDDFICCDKEMTDDLTIQAQTFIDCLAMLVKDDDTINSK